MVQPPSGSKLKHPSQGPTAGEGQGEPAVLSGGSAQRPAPSHARMRRKFGLLPAGNTKPCCSSPSRSDYLQWMFCWGCALAQEVRTANYLLLDVEAAGSVSQGGSIGGLQPLPRENGSFVTGTHSVPPPNYYSPSRGEELPLLLLKQDGSSLSGEMRPPVPPLMQNGVGYSGPQVQ